MKYGVGIIFLIAATISAVSAMRPRWAPCDPFTEAFLGLRHIQVLGTPEAPHRVGTFSEIAALISMRVLRNGWVVTSDTNQLYEVATTQRGIRTESRGKYGSTTKTSDHAIS